MRSIFKQHSRDRDLTARFGGEEFVVLLPGADYAEARNGADKALYQAKASGRNRVYCSETFAGG